MIRPKLTPEKTTLPIVGDPRCRTLLPVQALHSAGEALFAISLVGSLFFNVTVDAARPRILLYLAVTMAPFVVLAPLIGPVIDSMRGGHRAVLFVSVGGRAIVALLLASQLKSLLLYPQAFIIVVLAKVYAVSRNALIPSLVDDRSHLVVVNSRLARVGAISGVIAGLTGVGILQIADAPWVLRTGAIAYGLGALMTLRIPQPTPDPHPSAVVEATEMHGPGIQAATHGMIGMRLATGFVFFHVGFALKTSGAPAWLIGSVAMAAALGGLSGTFVAPRLHRRLDEQQMLTAALLLLAAASALAALRFHGSTAIALGASLGLAGSIGRRAFDGVVQTEAPHTRRGRAYAGLETRLEVGWVVGALVAVIARSPDWLGLLVLAVGVSALSADRIVSAVQASRLAGDTDIATLPFRLLETAEAVSARGDRQQAVLVALAAADAAAMIGTVPAEQMATLQSWGRAAANENDQAAEAEVLRMAHDLVTESALT